MPPMSRRMREPDMISEGFNAAGYAQAYIVDVRHHAKLVQAERAALRPNKIVLVEEFLAAFRHHEDPRGIFGRAYASGMEAFYKRLYRRLANRRDSVVDETCVRAAADSDEAFEASEARLAPVRRDVAKVVRKICDPSNSRPDMPVANIRYEVCGLSVLMAEWNRHAPAGGELTARTWLALLSGKGPEAVAFWSRVRALKSYGYERDRGSGNGDGGSLLPIFHGLRPNSGLVYQGAS